MSSDPLEKALALTADLAPRVVKACSEQQLTLASAESLTAGLVASSIATVPGASNVLRGGLIVYATELKTLLAGVDPELLRRQGAVDPEVAAQLARGAAVKCQADIGIGLTGVAGPDPQDGHPVGEVFVSWYLSGVASEKEDLTGQSVTKQMNIPNLPAEGDPAWIRAIVRQSAVNFALRGVLDCLDS